MVATTTKGLLQLELDYDADLECPNDWDCAWKLYGFSSKLNCYKHPEQLGLSLARDADGLPARMPLLLRRRLDVGLAFWVSYFEHGSSFWFRKGTQQPADMQWDGVRLAGLLVWDHGPAAMGAKTLEARAADADGFLKDYNAWANGEGYWWQIADANDEPVASCGGFYSEECALSAMAEYLVGEQFVLPNHWDRTNQDFLRDKVAELEKAREQRAR